MHKSELDLRTFFGINQKTESRCVWRSKRAGENFMEVRLAQLNIKNNFLKGDKKILLLVKEKGRNKKENGRKKEKIILS